MSQLAGRRALVGGSTQGIGRAAAEALAHEGAEVVLLARDAARLEAVRAALPASSGVRHEVLVADFSDPAAVAGLVAGHLANHPPIHILVNNTGGPPAGPVFGASPADFQAAFAMHLFTNHALVQAVVPGMRSAGYGRIINVVSTSVREPIRNLGVSNTVRAAVAGWAKTLSKELGPDGITVNNVLPGYTRTQRLESIVAARVKASGESVEAVERSLLSDVPLGRFAAPEELAAAILFLATPAAGYITGVSLPVDGGRLASI